MRKLSHRFAMVSIHAAVALCACGPDETEVAGNPSDAPVDSEPLYAITTQIVGESFTSYLLPVRSLEAGTDANLNAAIELPGRAVGVGPDSGGVVFVATDQSPVLSRYVAAG